MSPLRGAGARTIERADHPRERHVQVTLRHDLDKGPGVPSDHSRLAEIIASLKEALLHRSFEAGKFLIELKKEKNYGEWENFENFVESELRIKPRTVYRLMFAYEMRKLFKEHGRLLPVSEGSVRPLSEFRVDRQRTKITLTLEELQLKALEIAVAMKEKSTPTGADVRRAVGRLTG